MNMSVPPISFGIDADATTPGPIPFARLVRVEWAKATDTRAARWLFALVAVATAAMALVPVIAQDSFEQSQTGYLRALALVLTIPLPVVAILLFTAEWSQRSVITTFTQEPRRLRVVNAKLAVSLLLGVAAALFGGLVTAAGLGLAAASGRTVDANLTLAAVIGYVVFVLLNVLAAVALGALLQSSAAAIAASFALPATFAVVASASSVVAEWIDMATTWTWMLEGDWSGHAAKIAVSIVFWVVVPLAAGIVRTLRRDVA